MLLHTFIISSLIALSLASRSQAAPTRQASPKQVNTNAILVLEWSRLVTPAVEAGQKGRQLTARWRLK